MPDDAAAPQSLTSIAQEIAILVDMLPEQEQALAFEMIKRMVLAWDPDFTKVTDMERAQIEQAAAEMEAGEYVTDEAISWD